MSKATKSILILAGLYGFAVGFGVIEGINLSNKWWCRELQLGQDLINKEELLRRLLKTFIF